MNKDKKIQINKPIPKIEKQIALGAGTLMAPLPVVVVACGTPEESNWITVAWTGIVNTKPPMLSISLRPERKSHAILKKQPYFWVQCLAPEQSELADLIGTRSGYFVDKRVAYKLETYELLTGYPLALANCPISLACKVYSWQTLGSHDMILATIEECFCLEKLIDKDGAFSIEENQLLGYAHGQYFALGAYQGFFGEARCSEKALQNKIRRLSKKKQEKYKHMKDKTQESKRKRKRKLK